MGWEVKSQGAERASTKREERKGKDTARKQEIQHEERVKKRKGHSKKTGNTALISSSVVVQFRYIPDFLYQKFKDRTKDVCLFLYSFVKSKNKSFLFLRHESV